MVGRREKQDKAGKGGGAAAKKRRAEADDGAGLVEQDLTEAELKDRNDELISWLVKNEQTKTKKKAAVEKFNGELKLQGEKIRVLTRELDTGKAYVDPQESFDYPDPPPPPEGEPAAGNDAQAAAS